MDSLIMSPVRRTFSKLRIWVTVGQAAVRLPHCGAQTAAVAAENGRDALFVEQIHRLALRIVNHGGQLTFHAGAYRAIS